MIQELLKKSDLHDIWLKVRDSKRISETDCLRLYHSDDLAAIGAMANFAREQKNGNTAYYIVNRHINYSNICILDCDFCAFYRRPKEEGAYEFSISEMVERTRQALKHGITELHIVGGLHPTLKWNFYIDLLRSLKALDPNLHLKCFTAVEILHLSRISRKSVTDVIQSLREAGLGSITGGGAEILDSEVRKIICHAKETAEEWLDVHRTAHKLGVRSTATMLVGHVETAEHRVDHMRRLRELQDETRGFTAFVPLAFHPANTELSHLPGPSGYDMLRTLAIGRIYLDNFDHIKAYWIMLGLKLAQVSLSFGVDDLDGTVMEEKIYHMAGAQTPEELTRQQLVKAIQEAGREPVERDSLYSAVVRNPVARSKGELASSVTLDEKNNAAAGVSVSGRENGDADLNSEGGVSA